MEVGLPRRRWHDGPDFVVVGSSQTSVFEQENRAKQGEMGGKRGKSGAPIDDFAQPGG